MIAWFAVLVAGFLFFVVLPQRRKLAEFQMMQAGLEVGDDVLTTSGLYGRIVSIDGDRVGLEIAPATIVYFARAAIGRVVGDDVAGDDVVESTDGPGDAPGTPEADRAS